MSNRFRNLSIQDKLFTAFALTVLVAALSIAVSLALLLTVQTLSIKMVRTYQTAHEVYHAQSYLQEIEYSERTFLFSENVDDLDSFLIYNAQLEEYIRQMTLKASSAEIENALYEMGQAKNSYSELLGQISKAVLESHTIVQTDSLAVQTNSLIEQADLQLSQMRSQLALINEKTWEVFNQVEGEQATSLRIASITSLIALVFFLILAAYTALVISRGVFAPAARLSQAARALQEGSFSPEMLTSLERSPDEMGQLGRAFIQLAAALETEEAEAQAQIDKLRRMKSGG